MVFHLFLAYLRNRLSNRTPQVVIGHTNSDYFQMNLIKTDEINLQRQQIDSATAELFFYDQFCRNESDMEIDLHL